MLEIVDLAKHYGGQVALDGCSFQVEPGRLCGFLGPTGRARRRTIPGVDKRLAEVLIAELGVDMDVFPTQQQLASWAGMCPGNNESAGKRKSGTTRKGSKWLRSGLVEAAEGAARAKGSYFAAQYARLKGRRGHGRATIAVGHSILVTIYYVLKRGVSYQELGDDYFQQRQQEAADRYAKRLVRQLQRLGHKVTLEPADVA